MARFDPAIAKVLAHEGGYVNDPHDPGGETKYGISKRAYPDVDIKNLTLDKAKAIYRRDYWEPLRCGMWDQRLGENIFDAAVNAGVRRTTKQLQKILEVSVDGVLGPVTLDALKYAPTVLTNLELVLEREGFYIELARRDSGKRRYLIGWLTRARSYR